MGIRKIASHCILNSDGTIGQWPVVTFSSNGCLLSVSTTPEKFTEQPSLEFYGGLLLPGLIDDFADFGTNGNHPAKATLNRHFAAGTFMMRCSANCLPVPAKPPFLYRPSAGIVRSTPLSETTELPLFERIKNILLNPATHTLPQLLHTATAVAAGNAGVSNLAGSFTPGSYPGLLVLENIHLSQMKLTSASRLRWLVQGQMVPVSL